MATTTTPQISGRILLDIPCKVCQDHSSGKHYGIFACDGCAGFFKRSIRRNRQYVCKNRGTGQEGSCQVDKTHRNQCRACRLSKCAQVGMNKDAVQHERGPRNSTLRRQMALYFKETSLNSSSIPTSSTGPMDPNPFAPRGHTTNPSSMPPLNGPPPPFGAAGTFPTFVPPSPFGMMSGGPGGFGGFSPFWHGPFMASLAGNFLPPPPPPMPAVVASPPEMKLPPVSSPLFIATSNSNNNINTINSVKMETQNQKDQSSGSSSSDGEGSSTSSPDNSMKEQAARILFLTLNWPKTIPQFVGLPQNEQITVIRESWPELFMLAAGQYRFFTEESLAKLGKEFTEEQAGLEALKTAAAQLEALSPDPVELSCLRAFVLLKAGPPVMIEQIQLALTRYETIQHSGQPLRSVKLLMLLPALRSVSAELLEKLFFKETIGDVPMNRLVCDLYTASSASLAGAAAPPTTSMIKSIPQQIPMSNSCSPDV